MAIDLYSPLAHKIHRVAGCGVVRGETVGIGTDEKAGLLVVLRANNDLWAQIEQAAPFTYPEDVVDALRVMSSDIMQFVRAGQIHLTGCEPLTIAVATSTELTNARVALNNGQYTVPDVLQDDNIEDPNSPAGLWAATLQRFEIFDLAKPTHQHPFSFIFLPDREATIEECTRALMISDGWNWMNCMGIDGIMQLAQTLHEQQFAAQPLGM